jgi:CRISPR/Cas system-associated endonuclease Cas1
MVATPATLQKSVLIFGARHGTLQLEDGRLAFVSEDGTLFDFPVSEIESISRPWYMWGTAITVKAAGKKYFLNFNTPKTYWQRTGSALGAYSDVKSIATGRRAVALWRETLERPGEEAGS